MLGIALKAVVVRRMLEVGIRIIIYLEMREFEHIVAQPLARFECQLKKVIPGEVKNVVGAY